MKTVKSNFVGKNASHWNLILVLAFILYITVFDSPRAIAVTHDDADTVYPELIIRFKAVSGTTAKLNMSLSSYSMYDYADSKWTNYVESVQASSSSSSQWSSVSGIIMHGGVPLEMDNLLILNCTNVAAYQVMINTPDPKYQAFVNGVRQLMVSRYTAPGSTFSDTNHVMFFDEKRKGDNAGKAERISASGENFRICLGNGANGSPLGHLTLRKRSEPWVADASYEVGMYTVPTDADHYQIFAPQMTFDLLQDTNSGAYTVKAYDRMTEPGTPVYDANNQIEYLDFSSWNPTVTYNMGFSVSSGQNKTTENYTITRAEGSSTMVNKAALNINYVPPTVAVSLCTPPSCFSIPNFGSMCFPGFCTEIMNPGYYNVTNQLWDWKSQSSALPSRMTEATTVYTYNGISPLPISYTAERLVKWDADNEPLASDYIESSSSAQQFGSSDIFWKNYAINNDGSESQFDDSANYNFINYSPTKTGAGSHLKLDNQVLADGSWEQYTYSDVFESRGMVLTEAKPFKNTPASPGSTAGALVTSYGYTSNWDGSFSLPAGVTNTFIPTSGAHQVLSRTQYGYSASYAGTIGALPQNVYNTLTSFLTPSQINSIASQVAVDTATRAYSFYDDTSSGQPTIGLFYVKLWVTDQTNFASATDSAPAHSEVARFRDDDWPWLRGLPFYEINADGTENDYIYQQGTINYSTGMFEPMGSPALSVVTNRMAFRSIKIKGSIYGDSGSSELSSYSENNGCWFIQPIYLNPAQTTAEVRTTDGSGRLFSEETWVLNSSGSFVVSTKVLYSYDPAGNVIAKHRLFKDQNGVDDYQPIYEAEYTSANGDTLNYSSITFQNDWSATPYTGRKQYERGEDGSIKKYYYDDYGRIEKEVQLASPTVVNLSPVPAIQTLYQYDAENRKINTIVGPVQTGFAIDPTAMIHSMVYNLAGMVTNATDTEGRVTQYGYLNGGRAVTVTTKGVNDSTYDRSVTRTNYLDGQLMAVSGNATVPEFYNYNYVGGQKLTTNFIGSSTGSTLQWSATAEDGLGRVISATLSNPTSVGNLQLSGSYDSFGHLVDDSVSGLAPEISIYYPVNGQKVDSGLDMNGNGQLDAVSNDRISAQYTGMTYWNSAYWEAGQQGVYPNSGDSTFLVTDTTLKRSSDFPVQSITVLGTAMNMRLDSEEDDINVAGATTTTLHYYAPDSALTLDRTTSSLYTVPSDKIHLNGKLVCSVDSAGVRHDYTYDAYGRLSQETGRTGSTLYYYRTTPSGASTTEKQYVQTPDNIWMQSHYDPAGRVDWTEQYTSKNVSQPAGTAAGLYSRFAYNLRGQLTNAWGDAPVPTQNVYYEASDNQPELIGKLKQQTTYNGGGTSWTGSTWPSTSGLFGNATAYTYYRESGLVHTETHIKAEDSTSYTTTYTNDYLGRLVTRLTQRGIRTTYAYAPGSGELNAVSYTPAGSGTQMTYAYDRMGRLQTVVDAAGSRTFHYRSSDEQLDYENLPSNIYGPSCSFNCLYDAANRLDGGQFVTPTYSGTLSSTYTFDPASGQFQSITTPLSSSPFVYSYVPDSHLLGSVSCAGWPLSGASSFQINNTYRSDADILSSTVASGAGQTIASYTYGVDDQDRIQQATRSGLLFKYFGSLSENYGYDNRDELQSATTTATPNGSQVALPDRTLGYVYDNVGNRTSATRAGQTTTYSPNTLCQYASRSGPAVVQMSGLAGSGDSVTLKNNTDSSQASATMVTLSAPAAPADYYSGLFNFSGTASLLSLEADTYHQSTQVHSQQQNILVPAASEPFGYDLDGNLTNDSLWAYTYDGEDRLVQVQTLSSLPASVPRKRLVFTYDFLGRRVEKQIYNGDTSGTTWTLADTRCWVYDAWNPVAELEQTGGNAPVPVTYFAWGLDHSGTLHGAGGVGGLLGIETGLNTGSINNYAAIGDGLGNVTALVDAQNCNLVAEYEYNPFGELVRASGPMADQNPIRFSSKYYDSETSLVAFGFRYYSPGLGRFINRDPKSEQGWGNLFTSLNGGGGDSWNYVGELVDNAHETHYGGKESAFAETTESGDGYKDSTQSSAPMTDHKGGNSTMSADSDDSGDLPAGPQQMAGAPSWGHPYAFLRNSPLNDVEYLGLDPFQDVENWWNEGGATADIDYCAESIGSTMDDMAFGLPSSLYETVMGQDTEGNYADRSDAWNNFLVGGVEGASMFTFGAMGLAGEGMAAEGMAADAGSFEAGESFASEFAAPEMASESFASESFTSEFAAPEAAPEAAAPQQMEFNFAAPEAAPESFAPQQMEFNFAQPMPATEGTVQGGLNLFRSGQAGDATRQAVTGWGDGSRMLNLPKMGSPKANWGQNSGRLRQEMGRGEPIFDSYRDVTTGAQIPAGQQNR